MDNTKTNDLSLFKAAIIGSSVSAIILGILLKALHTFFVFAYEIHQLF